ncbi:hypothetical protein B0T13DRAFT_92405 [Neurospora crassa]|nr:hypothetical protein B0T13DRAFT_92405 [Neurospora crassa]
MLRHHPCLLPTVSLIARIGVLVCTHCYLSTDCNLAVSYEIRFRYGYHPPTTTTTTRTWRAMDCHVFGLTSPNHHPPRGYPIFFRRRLSHLGLPSERLSLQAGPPPQSKKLGCTTIATTPTLYLSSLPAEAILRAGAYLTPDRMPPSDPYVHM